MTLVRDLEATRALIAKPEHWTQGANARDSVGNPTFPASESATRWCLVGAAYLGGTNKSPRTFCVLSAMRRETPHFMRVALFNDTHTHAEVIALLDRAIAAAKMKEDGK